MTRLAICTMGVSGVSGDHFRWRFCLGLAVAFLLLPLASAEEFFFFGGCYQRDMLHVAFKFHKTNVVICCFLDSRCLLVLFQLFCCVFFSNIMGLSRQSSICIR